MSPLSRLIATALILATVLLGPVVTVHANGIYTTGVALPINVNHTQEK